MTGNCRRFSVDQICNWFGRSRQGYYQHKKLLERRRNEEEIILKLIHHSDRGIQYYSKAYINILKKHGVAISMTEQDHVYENVLAERVNGIPPGREEFYLGNTLQSKDVAKKLVHESAKIYNQKRSHMSLNYRTPESVYATA